MQIIHAMPTLFSKVTSLAVAVCSAAALYADVKLPGMFSDHMVLQREKPIVVWGWADDGEKITVRLGTDEASTEAREGKWKVLLPKMKAGGPLQLSVRGKNEINFNDVLIGEVWMCSGQSNMEWPLRFSFEPQNVITNAKNSKIRLLTVPKLKANEAVQDIKAKWVECDSSTVANFSAIAYYFGRDLQKALGVPIGLIHTSWGGSPVEAWLRQEVLAQNPLYQVEILEHYEKNQVKRVQGEIEKWEAEKTELEKAGKKISRERPSMPWKPAELYNGMIAPLVNYTIRGALWYQGESNTGRGYQYRTLFPDMIANWRADFGLGDFPFLLVQLAPYDKTKKREILEITKEPVESDWAELREAQWLSTKILPNVGMAVITDLGDKDDIHPKRKEPVGARLALLARQIAYGQRLVASGPIYRAVMIEGDKAIISFDSVGRGLEARGGTLQGFAIAGADRKFVWANAEIKGDTVVVSSTEVPAPVAVRYGWADFPVVNLFNKNGLPAAPFRTDNFPMTTGPRLVVKK
jgi:sialate O-acetylesterase